MQYMTRWVNLKCSRRPTWATYAVFGRIFLVNCVFKYATSNFIYTHNSSSSTNDTELPNVLRRDVSVCVCVYVIFIWTLSRMRYTWLLMYICRISRARARKQSLVYSKRINCNKWFSKHARACWVEWIENSLNTAQTRGICLVIILEIIMLHTYKILWICMYTFPEKRSVFAYIYICIMYIKWSHICTRARCCGDEI